MTASKAILLLFKNKKIRKVIIGIIVGILMIFFYISNMGTLLTFQTNTSLSAAAENEYEFWLSTKPEAAGYSCQGEKYCSHFNSGVVDWCAYFAGYCIEKAGLNSTDSGFSPSCSQWGRNLKSKELLQNAGAYSPQIGNLVFFNYSGRSSFKSSGTLNHVAIITEIHENNITIIEGNYYSGSTSNWASSSYVNKRTISTTDSNIACYGSVGSDDIVDYNIDFAISKDLSKETRNIITHNEIGVLYDKIVPSKFGSVVANDNGALSIGIYGWHGNKACELLKTAYSINSGEVQTVCRSYGKEGNKMLNAIKNSNNWTHFIPDSKQCKCIKAILLSKAGKDAQNKTSLQNADEYIKICKDNGLTKNKSIAYCSDILNQFGINSFKANVYSNGNDGVLHNIKDSMTLKSIYNSKAGWGSKSQYKSRRTWTYKYLTSHKIK